MADITIEFTIEPFTDGAPGAHVTRAIEAVEALGISVEIGPFGSTVRVDASRAGSVVCTHHCCICAWRYPRHHRY